MPKSIIDIVEQGSGGEEIGCRARGTLATLVTNSTPVAVTVDFADYDTDNMIPVGGTNKKINFNTSGKYIVGASVEFGGSTAGTYRQIAIRLNGTTTIARATASPPINALVNYSLEIVTEYEFTAGDYIELIADQNSGTTLQVSVFSEASPVMWARKSDRAAAL